MNTIPVLSMDAIRRQAQVDPHGLIRGVVTVHISDLLHCDEDGRLDLLAERLTGSILLMNINWQVIGLAAPNLLQIQVSGDPSHILGDAEDDQECATIR